MKTRIVAGSRGSRLALIQTEAVVARIKELHPSLDVIVMTPVCAHSMFTKPLVLPPHHTIEISARNESYPLTVSFDGAYMQQLQRGDKLQVSRGAQALRVCRPEDYDFYTVLRQKFQHGYVYGGDDA